MYKKVWMLCVAIVSYTMSLPAIEAGEKKQQWGALKGRVVWGQAPAPKDGKWEDWGVNPDNHGMRGIFVWLRHLPKDRSKKLPIHPDLRAIKQKSVEIKIKNKEYTPREVGIREGQKLIVTNLDKNDYVVRLQGNPFRNIADSCLIPPKRSFETKMLPADRFPVMIGSFQYVEMLGFIRVFDHPYFAITDKNANSRLTKLPPENGM